MGTSEYQPLVQRFGGPIVVTGFEPLDILFMYAATQIYGSLIHTERIGKLSDCRILNNNNRLFSAA